MTSLLDTMPPTEVGERLREARDRVKLKQAEAAETVGLSRTTLIAIEQGQRRVRIDELRKLANLYKMSINELMRQEAIHADLTPKFRKLFQQEDDAVERAVKQLEDLVRAEAELEQLLGVQSLRNYPPERPILPGDVRAQAEQDALDLRQRLGLGLSPISDIVTLLELELGVRVYIRRIDGGISTAITRAIAAPKRQPTSSGIWFLRGGSRRFWKRASLKTPVRSVTPTPSVEPS